MDAKMFCYQCQETAKGEGCILKGVCGKDFQTSNAMDLLMYSTSGICILSIKIIDSKKEYPLMDKVNEFVRDALFCTITNANFDEKSIKKRITESLKLRNDLAKYCTENNISYPLIAHTTWSADENAYDVVATTVSIMNEESEDKRSLQQLTIYGLKGMAAYTEHAARLGYFDTDVDTFMQQAMSSIALDSLNVEGLISLVLETGAKGVQAMALLDKANTERFGKPEITTVNLGVRKNPGILISGHDLKDMEDLLEQTEGTGVDVYTHSEMLPANYYPAFKKYKHFVGNYGNAWWQQKEEFTNFNGPILFTTNCIVPPSSNATYKDRVFTTNSTGYPGFTYIESKENGKKDFSQIINLAKTCQSPISIEEGTIVGGFAHHQVLQLADKIVEAVKNGDIKKFIVMAGCDGRQKGRNYYTEFAETLPNDTVILTAGCAKYRYNKLPLGDIGGIPRVLDAGQCNDSYSLAIIALKLKEVFGLEDINDLPIVYNIAWYEQKAVIVLLALLSLGVKNIHLGPTLPAFVSPNVLKILIDNFGISSISTVEQDMEAWVL